MLQINGTAREFCVLLFLANVDLYVSFIQTNYFIYMLQNIRTNIISSNSLDGQELLSKIFNKQWAILHNSESFQPACFRFGLTWRRIDRAIWQSACKDGPYLSKSLGLSAKPVHNSLDSRKRMHRAEGLPRGANLEIWQKKVPDVWTLFTNDPLSFFLDVNSLNPLISCATSPFWWFHPFLQRHVYFDKRRNIYLHIYLEDRLCKICCFLYSFVIVIKTFYTKDKEKKCIKREREKNSLAASVNFCCYVRNW